MSKPSSSSSSNSTFSQLSVLYENRVLVKENQDREIYCINSLLNVEDCDFVLIVNDVKEKIIKGFTGKISSEILKNWSKEKVKVIEGNNILDEVTKSLTRANGYGFDMDEKLARNETFIKIWKLFKGKKVEIGNCLLNPINESQALSFMMNETSKSVNGLTIENANYKEKLAAAEKKELEAMKTLKTLTIEKNHLEDKLYRAFYKLLNEKKKRIVELENNLNNARGIDMNGNSRKNKNRGRVMVGDSSDTEDEFVINQAIETAKRKALDNYDDDTDVDDDERTIGSKSTTTTTSSKTTPIKETPVNPVIDIDIDNSDMDSSQELTFLKSKLNKTNLKSTSPLKRNQRKRSEPPTSSSSAAATTKKPEPEIKRKKIKNPVIFDEDEDDNDDTDIDEDQIQSQGKANGNVNEGNKNTSTVMEDSQNLIDML